jgi:uncharacterized phage-associated protein
MYDSRVIANRFIQLAKEKGEHIDIAKIMKLVYIAHGWSLAILDKPLVKEGDIICGKRNVFIPAVYKAFEKKLQVPTK